ncbi:hypothetical protein EMCRGX_G034456 [Ephydatia muelleri]|eukprot:Em0023g374a
MRGVYLSYVSCEGRKKLVPRLEEHVILSDLGEYDVLIQVKACALRRIDTKTFCELLPNIAQLPVGFEISGTVTRVGSAVQRLLVSQDVVGLLPLDTESPGCAEYCIVPEYNLVPKPRSLSHVDAAAILAPALKAYTALYHHASRLGPKTTVMVLSAASADGQVVVQLCEVLETKVIAVVTSADEAMLLTKSYPSLTRIIDLSSCKSLVTSCLQETGGLGVNCIIDAGVQPSYSLSDFIIESPLLRQQLETEGYRHGYESAPPTTLCPTKHQLISCLAAHGCWITTQPDLQLDPPDSQLLFLKGASVHFLFVSVWLLSGDEQGTVLDMLTDIVKKAESRQLRPLITRTVTLDEVCELLPRLGTASVVMRSDQKLQGQ